MVIAALCLACSDAAYAEKGSRDKGLGAEVTLVSDYRYRGVSYTAGRPAVQGGVDIAASSGWFAGLWTSATLGQVRGSGEVDIYAGRSGTLAGVNYAVAGYAYLDRKVSHLQYVELQATLARDFGPISVGTEAAVAPRQDGGPTNIYLGLTGRVPTGRDGPALVLQGGYEDGFYRRKVDWSAGVEYGAAGFIISASVVGSTASRWSDAPRGVPLHGTGVVASVSRCF